MNYMSHPLKKPELDNNPVLIRVIQPEDREGVRTLVRSLHEKTIFGHMPFSDEKFDQKAEKIFSRPGHMQALVAEYKGKIIGFTWATVGRHAVSEEGFIATCHVLAVETDLQPEQKGIGYVTRRATTFLRLLKAIKLWSKTRGADHLMLHVTTGNTEEGISAKSTQRLLKKIDATSIGGAYLV